MGLDDAFITVRSKILSVDPLPTLGRSYAIATYEEKQKLVVGSRSPMIKATTLLAKGKKTGGHDNNKQ
ncbi:Integrase, catalytic core [Quillaja saponaria]|uniref:Integrase, catalytic core n=1 Tax=Quillaja saponaria TaxID=32244 RepID=A0AAD7P6I8_QUISA|nr:Integrase, catalytic core [Quillaja saponaria]